MDSAKLHHLNKEDIPVLIQRFLSRSQRPITLETDALDKIMAHHWPGNVRELENVIARAIALAPGEIITWTPYRSIQGHRTRLPIGYRK